MAAPALVPTNAADEMFPDSFGAEALTLAPFDTDAQARAFEPYPLTVELASLYQENGLSAPFELVVAAPSGRHDVVELAELPLAVMLRAQEGGTHRVTLREIGHNRWWGSTTIDVDGDPAR